MFVSAPNWIDGWKVLIVRLENVPTPLGDVSVHVIQTPCVGILLSNVVTAGRIAAVPGDQI